MCLLDLTYSVPVQVRDAALGIAQDDGAPKSDVGKEWALAAAAEAGTLGAVYQGAGPAGIGGGPGGQTPELLARLGARTPYYERNRAKLCSFFAKGECKRGAECPYRHEMPKTGPLAKQNIKDRYYGVNDPVANKMLAHLAEKAKIPPPADPTITTLFVGNLAPAATEGDVRDAFARFGALASVRAMPERAAAFVTFAARPDAERAAAELAGALTIRGQAAKLLWGRPQQGPPGAGPSGSGLVPVRGVRFGAGGGRREGRATAFHASLPHTHPTRILPNPNPLDLARAVPVHGPRRGGHAHPRR